MNISKQKGRQENRDLGIIAKDCYCYCCYFCRGNRGKGKGGHYTCFLNYNIENIMNGINPHWKMSIYLFVYLFIIYCLPSYHRVTIIEIMIEAKEI